jgi:hypothetical protein
MEDIVYPLDVKFVTLLYQNKIDRPGTVQPLAVTVVQQHFEIAIEMVE